MKVVGITGGIGTGKSTVCRVFATFGIPIYYADDRAKWLMSNDLSLKKQIIETFGEDCYVNGELNRVFLGQHVFKNKENTDIINSIVHPAVGKDFENWTKRQKSSYVLKEAALMFESDSYKQMDKIICVSSPIEIRVERILIRDKHRTKQDILNIIDKQYPEERKIDLSDYIIYNNQEQLLIPQVIEIDRILKNL